MAGGLVAHQIHVDVVVIEVLQQIHDVAVIGHGAGGTSGLMLPGDGHGLLQTVGAVADPALGIAGVDTGVIYLGDDGGGAGDLSSLALGAAHAAETGRDEQTSRQVAVIGDAQLQPSGVEQGVEGAVDDALRADVHPSAGSHLAVVGHAQGGGPVEVLLIVEGAHHQTVGDDDPGCQLVGMEQTQRMAGHDNQRLLIGQLLQILLDEPVLHPVLADLAGLAVGHQLIGIQRHVEVQVVVDHHLDSPALDALALVLADGLAVDLALGAEAIAVDAAVLRQLLSELLGHLCVVIGVDVAQGVLDGQRLVRLGQMGLPAGGPAIAALHLGVRWQLIVQLDGHCLVCQINHEYCLTFSCYSSISAETISSFLLYWNGTIMKSGKMIFHQKETAKRFTKGEGLLYNAV